MVDEIRTIVTLGAVIVATAVAITRNEWRCRMLEKRLEAQESLCKDHRAGEQILGRQVNDKLERVQSVLTRLDERLHWVVKTMKQNGKGSEAQPRGNVG